MTNKGLVGAGAAFVALSFVFLTTDLALPLLATVRVGEVEISDISEQLAARLFVFAIFVTIGAGMIAAGFKSEDSGRVIRKRH